MRNKVVVLAFAFGWVVAVSTLYGATQLKKPGRDVKGAEIVESIKRTKTTSPTKPAPSELSPTPALQQMQYGGWYYNPAAGRTQRYMGKDSAGTDLWTDSAN